MTKNIAIVCGSYHKKEIEIMLELASDQAEEEEIPTLYPVIPLKPRIHPVNVVEVIPVYEIISSSILSNPYSDGKPLVLGTVMVVSEVDIPDKIVVTPTITSGAKLSTFKY